MVQEFVDAAYVWLLGSLAILRQILPLVVLAALAAPLVWVAYRRLDGEHADANLDKLKRLRGPIGAGLAMIGLVVLFSGLFVQTRKTVKQRTTVLQLATASRKNEPQLSAVVQYAPSIAVIQDRTYTRTLTLPPSFLDRIGSEGMQVLAPYLSNPASDDALKVVDSFRRSGRDAVFTRQVTRLDEIPIAADSAKVDVAFADRGEPSGQRLYDLAYNATYRFHNPNPTPAPMRFNMPPPQGGGTIQGFSFTANGQKVTQPDEHGLYVWSATIPPNGYVQVDAHYQVTGGGGYDYNLGSERRRTGDFEMKVHSPRDLKFGRSGIYPNSVSGNVAEWNLKDVLTAQSIQLQFSRADEQVQLLDKTLSILPLVLILFAASTLWLFPGKALPASLTFGLGLLAIPVATGYTSPAVATIGGTLLAVIGGAVIIRDRRGWFVALLCGACADAFLTSVNGALAIWLLSLIGAALALSQIQLGRRALRIAAG